MILLGILILFGICYLGAWHQARVFNRRDKAAGFRPPHHDYRTSQQRLAKWR